MTVYTIESYILDYYILETLKTPHKTTGADKLIQQSIKLQG